MKRQASPPSKPIDYLARRLRDKVQQGSIVNWSGLFEEEKEEWRDITRYFLNMYEERRHLWKG